MSTLRVKRLSLALATVAIIALLGAQVMGCSSPTPSPTAAPKTTATTAPATSAAPTTAPATSAAPKPTATTPAATAKPAVTFAGKTITIIQGSAPGGGTDIQARGLSRWISKYLPGNPSVIVNAMPGGGTMIAMNYVSSVAKPDGLTLLGVSASTNVANLLGREGIKVPLNKLPLVMGVATSQIESMYTGLVDKFEDLYTKEVLVYGHMPPGGGTTGDFLIAKELLGIKVKKLLLGYGGTGDARQAYLSGEINASGGSTTGYYAVDWEREKAGEIVPMWAVTALDEKGNMTRLPPPFEKIPTLQERYVEHFGKQPSGVIWEAYKLHLGALCNFEKSYYLHPDTPADIVAAYRAGFDKMAHDPEFLKYAVDTLQIEVSTGDTMMKIFDDVMVKVNPEALKWYQDFFKIKYGVK